MYLRQKTSQSLGIQSSCGLCEKRAYTLRADPVSMYGGGYI